MEERALEQMILVRLQDIQENQQDIRERLAKVEVMLGELTDDMKDMKHTLRSHESRIKELESHKDATIGAKDIVTWLAMAGIALWGVMK